ncbi:hypothetical protein GGI11_001294 [Coemansia sp. RSA 2049]|nr:hypothetical protein GGI11_001294 [Coemansia sp. RSA 2049]
MSGVNVNHRYTEVFNGIAVRADSSVTPFDLASVDKVKRSTSDVMILKGLEMAVKDKLDIINLSLGGGSWPDEPVSVAAANIVKNGTVVVAASGNDGQGGLFTAGSPAVGNGVINVGSVQNWNYTVANLSVRNSKSSKSVRTTLSTSLGHPFSVDMETPIVAPTITSSPGGCGNVTDDLTGKVAIFTIQPECSHRLMVPMLQKAGATDIIMINNKPGLIYPTFIGVNASVITVTPEDGRIIMDMIAAGPTKINGPTSKTYYIPATDIAGQVSVYSSMGPDPYLNISPHIMAPGGNIYSTIPVKYGGYFVITGIPEHPYKIGSGLINVYDAVKARAKIFPPRLSLNSTTECSSSEYASTVVGSELWSVRNITLTNTDKYKDMYVTIDNSASAALSMYYPNGSIAYTPVVFEGASSSDGTDNSKPAIKLFNPPKVVKAGQKATYTVAIIAPTVLDNSDKWFFGGALEFKLQWASEATTSVYRVPYSGYSGDYSKLDVLAPPSSGFPSIRDDSGMPLVPGPLTISENRTASVFFSMALPSHLGFVQLVNSAKKAVGYLPDGYLKFVPHTCPLCSLPIINFAINSTVFTDEELINAVQVPTGSYSIHAAFLRPLGNPDNSADFQVWDSPVFTIA